MINIEDLVGTRWVCKHATCIYDVGDICTIRTVENARIGCEFDRDIDGHSLNTARERCLCKPGHGWWISKDAFFNKFYREVETAPSNIKYSFDAFISGEDEEESK